MFTKDIRDKLQSETVTEKRKACMSQLENEIDNALKVRGKVRPKWAGIGREDFI